MQFQSPDTLIPDQYNVLDWKRYAYARYNPINHNDPTGHCVDCIIIAIPVVAFAIGVAAYEIKNNVLWWDSKEAFEGSVQAGVDSAGTVLGVAVGVMSIVQLGQGAGQVVDYLKPSINNNSPYSQEGIATLEKHLERFGANPENEAMLERIKNGLATAWDINFYNHELIEAQHLAEGLSEREAHIFTLEQQGITYEPGYEAYLYAPEVIDEFVDYFNKAFQTVSNVVRNIME